jgi:hypothetical protein
MPYAVLCRAASSPVLGYRQPSNSTEGHSNGPSDAWVQHAGGAGSLDGHREGDVGVLAAGIADRDDVVVG